MLTGLTCKVVPRCITSTITFKGAIEVGTIGYIEADCRYNVTFIDVNLTVISGISRQEGSSCIIGDLFPFLFTCAGVMSYFIIACSVILARGTSTLIDFCLTVRASISCGKNIVTDRQFFSA